MATPELVVFLDGHEWTRISAPMFGARAWLLGVIAVQVTVERGTPIAILRSHVTGSPAAETAPLDSGALVEIALLPGESTTESIGVPAARSHGVPDAIASLDLFVDGAWQATAKLAAHSLAASPAPRGFGHVFCRWLRAGGVEPGYDLTSIVSQPIGKKFDRLVSAPLELGQTVAYRWWSSI